MDIPATSGVVVAEAPGLAFLGLRYQHRMSSALLGGVGEDAAFVVSALQREVCAESL
jgi:putative flavoprotein involved in K+ transport